MALILRMIYTSYQQFIEDNADKRIDNYFLMGSPLKLIGLTGLYWLFVTKLGPRFMANHQSYNLKYVMLVYNIVQVLANLILFYSALHILLTDAMYSDWNCMPRTQTGATTSVNLFYFFFMLKVVDYMDTVFMVLRKNYRQISYLHLYHHIIMALGTYVAARFFGSGPLSVLGLVNSLVHSVMYFYYFLAALWPELKTSVWKPYITKLQMLQFLTLILHFGRVILNRECDQPRIFMFFVFLQNFYMLTMFADFYIKTYIRKPKSKELKS